MNGGVSLLLYPDLMQDSEEIPDDEPAPAPIYRDGIDISLIRWTLSLTPLQRLEFLEQRIRDILYLRSLNAPE